MKYPLTEKEAKAFTKYIKKQIKVYCILPKGFRKTIRLQLINDCQINERTFYKWVRKYRDFFGTKVDEINEAVRKANKKEAN